MNNKTINTRASDRPRTAAQHKDIVIGTYTLNRLTPTRSSNGHLCSCLLANDHIKPNQTGRFQDVFDGYLLSQSACVIHVTNANATRTQRQTFAGF